MRGRTTTRVWPARPPASERNEMPMPVVHYLLLPLVGSRALNYLQAIGQRSSLSCRPLEREGEGEASQNSERERDEMEQVRETNPLHNYMT